MSERRARPRHPVRNEKGGALIMVTGFLVAILGIAALAIDVGMLFTARSEAQRAAEAGAHAGAVALLHNRDAEAARDRARDYAQDNQVRWIDVEVDRDDDIDVEIDNLLVRVRVHRAMGDEGPLAIPTFFARILGISEVNVGASAAAQVWPADGVRCVLPFALPDRWNIGPGFDDPAGPDDVYDEDRDDNYVPWEPGLEDYTGYSLNSKGARMQLYEGDAGPDDRVQPSWWNPFVPADEQRGNRPLVDRIRGCPDDHTYEIGETVDVDAEPGGGSGPQIASAFKEVRDSDPNLHWNDDETCVTERGDDTCVGPNSTDRIRPIALYDPGYPPGPGRSVPFTIQNFVAVFIEDVHDGGGNEVRVDARFVEYTALEPPEEWHDDDSVLQMVRIVE